MPTDWPPFHMHCGRAHPGYSRCRESGFSIHFINTAKPFLIRPFFSSFGQCRSEKRAGILGNIRHRSKESFRARKTRGKRWSCGSVAVGRQSAAFQSIDGNAGFASGTAGRQNKPAGCPAASPVRYCRSCGFAPEAEAAQKDLIKQKSPVKDGRSDRSAGMRPV